MCGDGPPAIEKSRPPVVIGAVIVRQVVNAASANIAAVYGENWLRGELVLIVEPLLARTACLKPDGSPYVFPSWYHWDGVAFWLVALPSALTYCAAPLAQPHLGGIVASAR